MRNLKTLPTLFSIMKRFVCKLAVALVATIGVALFFSACQPDTPPAPPAQAKAANTRFDITLAGKTVHLELAVTEWERAKGLMFRPTLAENDGMLFIFKTPTRQSFWMKNTEIPLDIGFFTQNGILQEIKPLYPHDLSGVNSTADNIALCLEMPQGWFAHNHVYAGATLDMAQVKAALRARGFAPKNFGL